MTVVVYRSRAISLLQLLGGLSASGRGSTLSYMRRSADPLLLHCRDRYVAQPDQEYTGESNRHLTVILLPLPTGIFGSFSQPCRLDDVFDGALKLFFGRPVTVYGRTQDRLYEAGKAAS